MIRFLYVDDDVDLLDITKESMETIGGFEVDTFASTSDALSALGKGGYQAVVSDYEMPDMDGIELLNEIRKGGDTVPFILFTGRGREEVAVKALNSGADFYLIKGGDPKAQFAELANMVRQAVSRREAERGVIEQLEQTKALNRMYRFLCDINHAVVHTTDRDALFEKCCRIAVEKGGFKMAVVGMLDRSTNIVSPFLHYGDGGDYLVEHRHDLNDDRERNSPMGEAVAENHMVICNSIETEPRFAPWRDKALRNGLRSSVYIPIRMDGKAIGMFVLYSSECNYFDEEELALMEKIVEYISQAVTYIRGEQRRQAVEQELVRKESRYRDTLDNMLEGCQIIGYDWRYIYLNDISERSSGKSREELLGRRMMDVYPGIERTDLFHMLRSCMEDRRPVRLTNEFPYSDGSMHWYELSVEPTNEGIFILSQDCTARIKAEREILAKGSKWRKLFEDAAGDIVFLDHNGTIMSTTPSAPKRKDDRCDVSSDTLRT
jgi:PAS domain S-box-containing protein